MSLSDLGNIAKHETETSDPADEEAFPLDSSIVITKFDPSPQRTHLIIRPRLTAALDAQLQARLTLITAPAGYGKTTLLTEWHRQLKERGLMVGWLSLDEDDSDAPHVIKCLALALARAGLTRAAKLASSPTLTNAGIKQHLTTLLNIVATEQRDVILVLDEFEHLPDSIVEDVFLPCLDKGPANLHLVIASREAPTLKLANLRTQGHVHEIHAEDLRFDLSEIHTLFGDAVNNAELRVLESQTSGWPVAVQLLKGVWSQQERRGQVLRDIETLDDTLTDYLSEQVFSALPREIFDLLVKLSPIDRMSPGIIEFMTGSDDAWMRIMAADALAPFLIPLDASLKVYRSHPIIRAYFKAQLDSLPAGERTPVYRRAAQWYATAGRLVSALHCTNAARDTDLAGSLIEDAGGLKIWLKSGLPRLKAIIEALDENVQEAFPRVKLLHAFLHVKEGNLGEARRLHEEVRRETQNFEQDRPGGDITALKLDRLVLESTLLVNEGRAASDSYLDRYERTLRKISENDDVFLGNIKILLAISHNQRGYFDKALKEALEGIDHYRQARLIHGEFFASLHRGTSLFALGRSAEARDVYAAVRNLWRSDLNEEKTKLALLKAQTGELEYECTDSPPSMRALTETMGVFEQCEWWYDTFAAAAFPLVMTLLAAQGKQAALDEIDRCRKIIEKRQASGLGPLFDALEVSCLALSGDIDLARTRLDQYGFSPENLLDHENSEVTWRQQEAAASAIARVYIRDGRERAAAEFLGQVLDRCMARDNVRSMIRLGLLKAIAEDAAGDFDSSRTTLGTVLKHVAASGYIRAFAEEGPLSAGLLQKHRAAISQQKDLTDHERQLLNRLAAPSEPSAKGTGKPTLSVRELTVIREVAEGLTDKEIARKLDLTPNTVKFHLKNVFRKLGVRNRAQAVSYSRDLGLIA